MSPDTPVLDQNEMDALLKGVAENEVPVEAGTSVDGEIRPFDMATQSRIARARMPALVMINERFGRLLRAGLFNLTRRTADVSVEPIEVRKFSEYLKTQRFPASLSVIRMPPLHGGALLAMDGKLVFSLVDSFFGGAGKYAEIESREFTTTEIRIVQMVMRQVFADLQEAWAPVSPLKIELVNSEMNPRFINIISPSEVVVVTSFRVALEEGGGELQVTMPYSMIEPIRELVDAEVGSAPSDSSELWARTLREEIEDVMVEVRPQLGFAHMTVRQLMELKAGDVIPCDFDGNVTLLAEGNPFLRGAYGSSRGQQAIKVSRRIVKRTNTPPDAVRKGGL